MFSKTFRDGGQINIRNRYRIPDFGQEYSEDVVLKSTLADEQRGRRE